MSAGQLHNSTAGTSAIFQMFREAVEAPSLETFQARLDGALSNLVWLKMSLLTAGGLG